MALIPINPNEGCQPGASQCPANFSRPLTLYDLIDYQLKVDNNINGPNKVLIDVINYLLLRTGGLSITYNELVNLIESDNLVPGSYYIITDYQDNQMLIGVEPIIVYSLTSNTLSEYAYSTLYPNQILYYNYLDQPDGFETGTVFKRKYDDEFGDTVIIDF